MSDISLKFSCDKSAVRGADGAALNALLLLPVRTASLRCDEHHAEASRESRLRVTFGIIHGQHILLFTLVHAIQ